MKGDSLVVINIARRLQNGATIGQVSKGQRWECNIIALRSWLRDNPALRFSHVKRTGNRVEDALENEGVGKVSSFHAEETDDKRDGPLWRKCEALAVDNVKKTNVGQPQQLSTPQPPM